MVAEFNNLLQGLFTKQEETPTDSVEDQIDQVLGEEGDESRDDEPPC